MGACAFGVDHALGNTLTSEVSQFVKEVKVLNKQGSTWTGGHRVLVVIKGVTR